MYGSERFQKPFYLSICDTGDVSVRTYQMTYPDISIVRVEDVFVVRVEDVFVVRVEDVFVVRVEDEKSIMHHRPVMCIMMYPT